MENNFMNIAAILAALRRSVALLCLLLFCSSYNQALASVTYSSSPAAGTQVSGINIWLRLNSIDSAGNANFTIGKISGTFTASGTFQILSNGVSRGPLNYSAGVGAVSFNLPMGSSAGTFAIKAQRYDPANIPGGYDQNVISGVVYITVADATPSPVVSGFAPNAGTVGTTANVTVSGSNFPSTLIVNIDGQTTGCSQQSVSANQANFSCPLSVTGARLFEVKTNTGANGGVVIYQGTFNVNAATPVVSGFTPNAGTVGTIANVNVSGSNFPNTLIANIDGQTTGCSQQSVSANQANFSCPLSVTGARLFEVKTNTGANGGVVIYQGTFNVNAATPVVSGFTPNVGTAGTGMCQSF